MRVCRTLSLLVLLSLTACGPMIGQLMKAGEGIRSFEVTEGQLSDLTAGKNVLVFGPFAKTDGAFYLCRGEDAANFSAAIGDAGLFETELYLERNYDRTEDTAREIRQRAPAQLRSDLGLRQEPDLILFGTILQRSTIVAPARGVVMDVGYRLEFFDLRTRSVVAVEVSAKELFERVTLDIVRELAERLAIAGS